LNNIDLQQVGMRGATHHGCCCLP